MPKRAYSKLPQSLGHVHKMASTMADAALANANDSPAVVAELMLERERLAMDREALRSFVVERHYVRAPDFSEDEVWSWRRAFGLQADVLRNIRDHAMDIDDRAHGTVLEASVEASMNDLKRELKEAVELSSEIVGLSRGRGTNR